MIDIKKSRRKAACQNTARYTLTTHREWTLWTLGCILKIKDIASSGKGLWQACQMDKGTVKVASGAQPPN